MRRAFQRCSASLPRTLYASSSSSARIQLESLKGLHNTHNVITRSYPAARRIHQSSALCQAPDSEQDTSANGGKNALVTRFEELGTRNLVHSNIVQTLTRNMGLETMTEVQSATINEALKGTDIIAQAKTGTGKTLAFLLPILQRILQVDPELANRTGGRHGPRTTADDIRGLIISPTRELAEQIAEEAKKLTQNTGVIVQTAVGGTQKSIGLRAIQRQGCHLLVGTPGRLKDILTDPYSRVEAPDLSALVFDEADRLLDQGFWPEIQEIMQLLPTPAEKDRQTMMFSATIPRDVIDLVRRTLKPGFQFVKCVRDDEQPTHERVPQKVVRINGFENSLPTLIEICQRGCEAAQEPDARPFKAIIYYNSTAEVTLATSALQNLEVPTASEESSGDAFGRRRQPHPFGSARIWEIHAKLTQAQRTRAADSFRNCKTGILISSDVTARGMDFPNVTHVIQMGLPSSKEQYIHRIGRTARAGKEGEGWLVLNSIEAEEARSRLYKIPLAKDDTLSVPSLDLTKAADVPSGAGRILSMYQKAIKRVPMGEKAKVYLAQLGVFQWYPRKAILIQAMNNLSQFGWGLREPPAVSSALASRLKLRSIDGVRIDDARDRFGGDRPSGDRFGGRDDRNGGRENRYGGRGRTGYGAPPRQYGDTNAFGRKPVHNDPFA